MTWTPLKTLLFLVVLRGVSLYGQQAVTPQPTQAQVQPCVPTSTTPNPSGPKVTIKVPSKWRQTLDKQIRKMEVQSGVPISEVTADVAQAATSKPAPCIPQTVAAKAVPVAQAPVKLPPDITTTTTLHCNPIDPSSKDASGHPTTLTLPDPHALGTPKPSEMEVDAVVPDLKATTGCWKVRVNPATGRSFATQ